MNCDKYTENLKGLNLDRRRSWHKLDDAEFESLKELQKDWKTWDVFSGYQNVLHPEAILMSYYDYLNAGTEPRIQEIQAPIIYQQIVATKDQNCGAADVIRPVYIYALKNNPLPAFEYKFAAFLKAEDGIAMQPGLEANSVLIQSIWSPNLPVYLDFAILSKWGSAQLGSAQIHRLRTNEMADGRQRLRERSNDFRLGRTGYEGTEHSTATRKYNTEAKGSVSLSVAPAAPVDRPVLQLPVNTGLSDEQLERARPARMTTENSVATLPRMTMAAAVSTWSLLNLLFRSIILNAKMLKINLAV